MTGPLIVGAMVRTLGAYPSGWRHPGAHRDPLGDADVGTAGEQLGSIADGDGLVELQ